MARALTVGSALWVAVFATAFAILTALPKPELPVIPLPPEPWTPKNWDVLKPNMTPPPSANPTPIRAREGVVVPVPPVEAPPPVVESHNDGPGSSGAVSTTPQGPPAHSPRSPGSRKGPPPIVQVWETDELPEAITEVKPIYPELAREAGIDGRVIVEVTIGPNGRIEDAHVVKSIPVLDAAALEAARRWVFTAPLAHGHPVRVRYTIPFVFELH
jgi:protein TonB